MLVKCSSYVLYHLYAVVLLGCCRLVRLLELLQGLVVTRPISHKFLGYEVNRVPEMHQLIFSRLTDYYNTQGQVRLAGDTSPRFWGAGLVWFFEAAAYEALSTTSVRLAHVFNEQFLRGLFPIDTMAGLQHTLALAFPITEAEEAESEAEQMRLEEAAGQRRR